MSVTVVDREVARPTRWDDIVDWTGSVRAVAVLRIALGPVTLLHLRPFLREVRRGVAYDDHFWHPFFPWLPDLPDRAWFALIWIGVVAALLMTVGALTRLATTTTFAVVTINLLLSTTHYHHNRAFLMILLAALALMPAGRTLSVDAWLRRRVGRPPVDVGALWPLWLVRVQVCLVYLASGVSKLVDPDWIGGRVLWIRVVRHRSQLEASPLPGWALDLLTQRWFHSITSPMAVATELFVGVGLLVARTRTTAIWVALLFHVMIEITSSVQVFSLAAVAALAIWVRPATGEHEVIVGGSEGRSRLLCAAIRLGDWFARFRVVPSPGAPTLRVVDRCGHLWTGGDAWLFVLRRIPLTFPFAAPIAVLRERRPATPAPALDQSSGSV